MLVAICGIDGSGKTRLARSLARNTGGLYRKQCVGPMFDQMVRDAGLPVEDELPSARGQRLAEAYAQDFIVYAHRYGLRAAPRSRPVFLDRWATCVEVFAAVFAPNPLVVRAKISRVPVPDWEILLDLDPDLALQRILRRGETDWDETATLLTRLSANYVEAIQRGKRTSIIDASLPADEVLRIALGIVEGLPSPPSTTF